MTEDWVYLPVRPNDQAKIDPDDFERCMQHTWRVLVKANGRRKVVTNIIDADGRNRQISLGQFLLSPGEGLMVYPRRFMRGFDYRKGNLVVCTMAERQRLLPKMRKEGSSRFKGVSFINSKNRWRASIRVEGKLQILGHFSSEQEAAQVYNREALKVFGNIAYQNQVHRPDERRKGE